MPQSALSVDKIITGSMVAPDPDLEYGITHEWNANIITYPDKEFPFSEWILNSLLHRFVRDVIVPKGKLRTSGGTRFT